MLSLFDGISCGYLALKRSGLNINTYYASEIESHAEGISKYHFPDIIRLGDVNNYAEWDLQHINLLIGGSPCQDLSIAKANRKGLDGDKSGLFWKYVDCLEKFNPEYFLLENNFSMPKVARNKITEILGVEPIMINSDLVSAQNRKRLYWTNIAGVQQPKDKKIILSQILESGKVDRDKALCVTRRYAGFHGSQALLCRRYFGKSFGQAVFEKDINTIKELWKQNPFFESDDSNIRQMTIRECERLQTLPDDFTKYEVWKGEVRETPKIARYEAVGNGWTVDVISHILSYLESVVNDKHRSNTKD